MATVPDYYGTIEDAASYFADRLHESAWTDASPTDRVKALRAATRRIDALNFKGAKHSVYAALLADPLASVETADLAQELEFPRGTDTTVPDVIERACYEIAHSLLDGKDPELALEAISVSSQGYSSVRTSYARDQAPLEHVMNLIPSAIAWTLLKPFLRDSDEVGLSRIS